MLKKIDMRRKTILNMVNEFGTIDFSQLRDAFPNISDVTLRKDLEFLDKTQQAVRIHGGLKSIPSALNYYYRANVNHDKKKEIGIKASKLIQHGDSIFISAGSTCAELARHLPVFPIKVCSDGIYTVSNIAALPNISVDLLGGDVDLNIMRVEGISTINSLENRHFDISFIGALNSNIDFGFSHNNAMTVAILNKIIEKSNKVVVLMDSTKISSTPLKYTIPFSSIDILVSDENLPTLFSTFLTELGITIL